MDRSGTCLFFDIGPASACFETASLLQDCATELGARQARSLRARGLTHVIWDRGSLKTLVAVLEHDQVLAVTPAWIEASGMSQHRASEASFATDPTPQGASDRLGMLSTSDGHSLPKLPSKSACGRAKSAVGATARRSRAEAPAKPATAPAKRHHLGDTALSKARKSAKEEEAVLKAAKRTQRALAIDLAALPKADDAMLRFSQRPEDAYPSDIDADSDVSDPLPPSRVRRSGPFRHASGARPDDGREGQDEAVGMKDSAMPRHGSRSRAQLHAETEHPQPRRVKRRLAGLRRTTRSKFTTTSMSEASNAPDVDKAAGLGAHEAAWLPSTQSGAAALLAFSKTAAAAASSANAATSVCPRDTTVDAQPERTQLSTSQVAGSLHALAESASKSRSKRRSRARSATGVAHSHDTSSGELVVAEARSESGQGEIVIPVGRVALPSSSSSPSAIAVDEALPNGVGRHMPSLAVESCESESSEAAPAAGWPTLIVLCVTACTDDDVESAQDVVAILDAAGPAMEPLPASAGSGSRGGGGERKRQRSRSRQSVEPYCRFAQSASCDVTHLIVGGARRTLKLFLAMASGSWVLRPSWLAACKRAGGWVAEQPHVARFASMPGAALGSAWAGGNVRQPLLLGEVVCIGRLGQQDMARVDVERIVRAAGGGIAAEPGLATFYVVGKAGERRRGFMPEARDSDAEAPDPVQLEWLLQSVLACRRLPVCSFLIHQGEEIRQTGVRLVMGEDPVVALSKASRIASRPGYVASQSADRKEPAASTVGDDSTVGPPAGSQLKRRGGRGHEGLSASAPRPPRRRATPNFGRRSVPEQPACSVPATSATASSQGRLLQQDVASSCATEMQAAAALRSSSSGSVRRSRRSAAVVAKAAVSGMGRFAGLISADELRQAAKLEATMLANACRSPRADAVEASMNFTAEGVANSHGGDGGLECGEESDGSFAQAVATTSRPKRHKRARSDTAVKDASQSDDDGAGDAGEASLCVDEQLAILHGHRQASPKTNGNAINPDVCAASPSLSSSGPGHAEFPLLPIATNAASPALSDSPALLAAVSDRQGRRRLRRATPSQSPQPEAASSLGRSPLARQAAAPVMPGSGLRGRAAMAQREFGDDGSVAESAPTAQPPPSVLKRAQAVPEAKSVVLSRRAKRSLGSPPQSASRIQPAGAPPSGSRSAPRSAIAAAGAAYAAMVEAQGRRAGRLSFRGVRSTAKTLALDNIANEDSGAAAGETRRSPSRSASSDISDTAEVPSQPHASMTASGHAPADEPAAHDNNVESKAVDEEDEDEVMEPATPGSLPGSTSRRRSRFVGGARQQQSVIASVAASDADTSNCDGAEDIEECSDDGMPLVRSSRQAARVSRTGKHASHRHWSMAYPPRTAPDDGTDAHSPDGGRGVVNHDVVDAIDSSTPQQHPRQSAGAGAPAASLSLPEGSSPIILSVLQLVAAPTTVAKGAERAGGLEPGAEFEQTLAAEFGSAIKPPTARIAESGDSWPDAATLGARAKGLLGPSDGAVRNPNQCSEAARRGGGSVTVGVKAVAVPLSETMSAGLSTGSSSSGEPADEAGDGRSKPQAVPAAHGPGGNRRKSVQFQKSSLECKSAAASRAEVEALDSASSCGCRDEARGILEDVPAPIVATAPDGYSILMEKGQLAAESQGDDFDEPLSAGLMLTTPAAPHSVTRSASTGRDSDPAPRTDTRSHGCASASTHRAVKPAKSESDGYGQSTLPWVASPHRAPHDPVSAAGTSVQTRRYRREQDGDKAVRRLDFPGGGPNADEESPSRLVDQKGCDNVQDNAVRRGMSLAGEETQGGSVWHERQSDDFGDEVV